VVEYLKEQGRCKYTSLENPVIDEGKEQDWAILLRAMSGVSDTYREFDRVLRCESGSSWRLDSISKNKIDKAYFIWHGLLPGSDEGKVKYRKDHFQAMYYESDPDTLYKLFQGHEEFDCLINDPDLRLMYNYIRDSKRSFDEEIFSSQFEMLERAAWSGSVEAQYEISQHYLSRFNFNLVTAESNEAAVENDLLWKKYEYFLKMAAGHGHVKARAEVSDNSESPHPYELEGRIGRSFKIHESLFKSDPRGKLELFYASQDLEILKNMIFGGAPTEVALLKRVLDAEAQEEVSARGYGLACAVSDLVDENGKKKKLQLQDVGGAARGVIKKAADGENTAAKIKYGLLLYSNGGGDLEVKRQVLKLLLDGVIGVGEAISELDKKEALKKIEKILEGKNTLLDERFDCQKILQITKLDLAGKAQFNLVSHIAEVLTQGGGGIMDKLELEKRKVGLLKSSAKSHTPAKEALVLGFCELGYDLDINEIKEFRNFRKKSGYAIATRLYNIVFSASAPFDDEIVRGYKDEFLYYCENPKIRAAVKKECPKWIDSEVVEIPKEGAVESSIVAAVSDFVSASTQVLAPKVKPSKRDRIKARQASSIPGKKKCDLELEEEERIKAEARKKLDALKRAKEEQVAAELRAAEALVNIDSPPESPNMGRGAASTNLKGSTEGNSTHYLKKKSTLELEQEEVDAFLKNGEKINFLSDLPPFLYKKLDGIIESGHQVLLKGSRVYQSAPSLRTPSDLDIEIILQGMDSLTSKEVQAKVAKDFSLNGEWTLHEDKDRNNLTVGFKDEARRIDISFYVSGKKPPSKLGWASSKDIKIGFEEPSRIAQTVMPEGLEDLIKERLGSVSKFNSIVLSWREVNFIVANVAASGFLGGIFVVDSQFLTLILAGILMLCW
jgi:hypothetical protein